jgi:hypothetical protein
MPDTQQLAAEIVAAPNIRGAIDRWFNDHIAGSAVARSVEAYNHLRTVLNHLHSEIADAIAKEI